MRDRGRLDGLLATKRAMQVAGGNLDRVLDAIVRDGLAAMPDADGAIIEMREAGMISYRAASGKATRLVGRKVELGRSFAGRSILARAPAICDDIEKVSGIDLALYREAGMRSLISVPLVMRGRSFGVLKYYSSVPGAFVERDLTIAELVATELIEGLRTYAEESAARARQTSAARFEAITETLPQLIWIMTPEGVPSYCNRRMLRFLAVDQIEDFDGNILSIIDPHFHEAAHVLWQTAVADQKPVSIECRFRSYGAGSRWMLVHVAPVPPFELDAAPQEWICMATDIDGRKAMELALQESVKARDLLLYEVNHRVKNSLQIVTGLLALHATRIRDPDARARLLAARSQVATIAQVHQSIYQTSHHDQVEFIGILRALAGGLIGQGKNRTAELVFSGPETLYLPIDQGVPVALAAGEVITNAVKHATDRDDAQIGIIVSVADNGYVLEITDNGPGLPPDFDPRQSHGLGMEIIIGLAEQAGGRLEIHNLISGVCFRLIFD